MDYEDEEETEETDERPYGFVKIGSFGVDSGQVMITDPCYVKDFVGDDKEDFNEDTIKKMQESGKFEYSYNGACAVTLGNPGAGTIGKYDAGVVSSTGYGDGCYPVYAKYKGGRVKELLIEFF